MCFFCKMTILVLLFSVLMLICWITFANSLDPDQGQEMVRLDIDPNCLRL